MVGLMKLLRADCHSLRRSDRHPHLSVNGGGPATHIRFPVDGGQGGVTAWPFALSYRGRQLRFPLHAQQNLSLSSHILVIPKDHSS